jgi:hypothetical protein
MTATIVKPGLYRVRGAGIDQLVIASHGCDAISALICEVLA